MKPIWNARLELAGDEGRHQHRMKAHLRPAGVQQAEAQTEQQQQIGIASA